MHHLSTCQKQNQYDVINEIRKQLGILTKDICGSNVRLTENDYLLLENLGKISDELFVICNEVKQDLDNYLFVESVSMENRSINV